MDDRLLEGRAAKSLVARPGARDRTRTGHPRHGKKGGYLVSRATFANALLGKLNKINACGKSAEATPL
jgi:hypothetical protein